MTLFILIDEGHWKIIKILLTKQILKISIGPEKSLTTTFDENSKFRFV